VQTLLPLLRKDVVYVTVVQYLEGLAQHVDRWPGLAAAAPHILVLSAGGNGHVPLPLLKGELPRGNASNHVDARMPFASWVGQRYEGLRSRTVSAFERHGDAAVSVYQGADWVRVLTNATVALAPRGIGRTSFRLYEALQLGAVPVYVWDDVEWLPYKQPLRTALEDAGAGSVGSTSPGTHVGNATLPALQAGAAVLADQVPVSEAAVAITEALLGRASWLSVLKRISALPTVTAQTGDTAAAVPRLEAHSLAQQLQRIEAVACGGPGHGAEEPGQEVFSPPTAPQAAAHRDGDEGQVSSSSPPADRNPWLRWGFSLHISQVELFAALHVALPAWNASWQPVQGGSRATSPSGGASDHDGGDGLERRRQWTPATVISCMRRNVAADRLAFTYTGIVQSIWLWAKNLGAVEPLKLRLADSEFAASESESASAAWNHKDRLGLGLAGAGGASATGQGTAQRSRWDGLDDGAAWPLPLQCTHKPRTPR
jgi:hypothetical protein